MGLVLGTNCGFVTESPVADPSEGSTIPCDQRAIALKDTAPVSALKITEIGWWSNNISEDVNFEVGLYDHNVGDNNPEAILFEDDTNAKGTTAGWKRVSVDWTITPSTIYWLAIYVADSVTGSRMDDVRAVGNKRDYKTLLASLPNPWGTTTNTTDDIVAIYAVWEGKRLKEQTIIGGLETTHDFKRFPELRNSQMDELYFDSPHKQITENFFCDVVRVIDGDTIRVKWFERDFDFPVRVLEIDAPELSEPRGHAVKDWLVDRIEGEEIQILINKQNRVDKFGRLLGKIFHRGMDAGKEMMNLGMVTSFEARHEGKIPDINRELNIERWTK